MTNSLPSLQAALLCSEALIIRLNLQCARQRERGRKEKGRERYSNCDPEVRVLDFSHKVFGFGDSVFGFWEL